MLNIVTETAHTVELLVIKMELSLMENLGLQNIQSQMKEWPEIPAAQVELLKTAVIKNAELVESKLHEIIEFVKSIPGSYKGYEIISEPRREYYLKSFITRFEDVLKNRKNELQ